MYHSRTPRGKRATFSVGRTDGGQAPPTIYDNSNFYEKAPAKNALDVDDVRRRLNNLKPFAETRVSDLVVESDVQEDHHALYGYALLTASIPDERARFYELVIEVLGREEPYPPLTIGAFYTGCANVVDGCSLSCPGALRAPNVSECSLAVIYAEMKDNALSYTSLNQKRGSRALLYIPDSVTFVGVDAKVVEFYKNLGIVEVRVIRYTKDFSVDAASAGTNIVDGFVPIETLVYKKSPPSDTPVTAPSASVSPAATIAQKSQKTQSPRLTQPPRPTKKTAFAWWAILIVILVALVIILLVVVLFKTRSPAPAKAPNSSYSSGW